MRAARHVTIPLTAAAIAALLSASIPALAADQIVPLPEGWTLAGDLFSAGINDSVAVPLRSEDPAGPARILQVLGQDAVVTDIPGTVQALTLAVDGKHLLVRHVTTGLDETGASTHASLISLVDARGTLLWTREDARGFEFSTTGEALVAGPGAAEKAGRRGELEIFDLKGESRHKVEPGAVPLVGSLLVGDGTRVLLATERTLTCRDLAADGAGQVLWTYHLVRSEPDVNRLFSLTPDRIVLGLGPSRFKLFTHAGEVVYDYDIESEVLRSGDGASTAAASTCGLIISDGTSEVRMLTLASGSIQRKAMNLETPGYRRLGAPLRGKLLFAGEGSILIRFLRDSFIDPPVTGQQQTPAAAASAAQ